jgi:hypothetical protein
VDAAYKADFLLKTGKQALRSIRRLLPGFAYLKNRIKAEERALSQCIKRELDLSADSTRPARVARGARRAKPLARDDQYAGLRVRRLLAGPVDTGAALNEVSVQKRRRYRRWIGKESQARIIEVLGQYWADGRRSISEISRLVAAETGYSNPDFLRFYFGVLEEAGLVEISKE